MKKSILVSGLTMIVAGGSLASQPVHAEGPVSVSANVALSTDYVFRYVSQTMEEPAISGGFDLAFADTGFYLGTWASNVDFGDDATIEIDFYGGWTTEFGNGLGLDVGIIDYEYFDDDSNPNIVEIYGGLSYGIASATLYYGVDNELGEDSDTDNYFWIEGELSHDFGPAAVTGTIGRFESDDFDDEYFGWSIGVSTELLGLGLDLTYYDTDSDGEDLFGDDLAGDRVVFTVSKEI